MKSTGIVRELDSLGRVVLPMEMRKTMNIDKNTPLEIYVEGDNIILHKYEPSCLFCGSSDELISYQDRKVCKACLAELNRIQCEK